MADAAAKGKEVLDQSVWETCAGHGVKMPPVGSLVYYFPRGHVDYAFGLLNFPSRRTAITEPYLCKIKEIKLLVSEETDEVYSVIELDPSDARSEPSQNLIPLREHNPIRFSSKNLDLEDARGSMIRIPEACAELVFPALDMSQTSPSQALHIRDLRGKVWPFEHRYGGSPAHHYLTTGWKEFSVGKRLRLGDSVVFMKNEAGELLVGVRRCPPNYALLFFTGAGLRRDYGANITAEDVVKAVRLAERGLPFKVSYYPSAGWPSFIVFKKTVDSALRMPWPVGLRIKKARGKGKGASGTVTRFCLDETSVSWPWKCLEVCWDEPKVVEMVSPWEVAPAEELKKNEMNPSSSAAAAGVFPGAASLARVEGGRREQSRLPAGGVSGESKDLVSDIAEKKNEMNPSSSAAEAGVFSGAASPGGIEGSRPDQSSLPAGGVSGESKDLASDRAEKKDKMNPSSSLAEERVFSGAASLAGMEGSRRDHSNLPYGGVYGEFKDLASDSAEKKNEMKPPSSAAEAGVFSGAASLAGMEGSRRDRSNLPSGGVSGEFKDLASDSAEKKKEMKPPSSAAEAGVLSGAASLVGLEGSRRANLAAGGSSGFIKLFGTCILVGNPTAAASVASMEGSRRDRSNLPAGGVSGEFKDARSLNSPDTAEKKYEMNPPSSAEVAAVFSAAASLASMKGGRPDQSSLPAGGVSGEFKDFASDSAENKNEMNPSSSPAEAGVVSGVASLAGMEGSRPDQSNLPAGGGSGSIKLFGKTILVRNPTAANSSEPLNEANE